MLKHKIHQIEHSDLAIPSFIKKGALERLRYRLRVETRKRDNEILKDHKIIILNK